MGRFMFKMSVLSNLSYIFDCSPDQNPNRLFCGFLKLTHKFIWKVKSGQHNDEAEEQNWRTDSTQPQDLP